MEMLGRILSLVTRLVDHFVLYHPQIVPVLVAQSVVSKSVQSSKNMVQTQIILEHSTNSEHNDIHTNSCILFVIYIDQYMLFNMCEE